MRASKMYENDNGVVKVLLNFTKESDELAYITITAGYGKIHINADYLEDLENIIKQIRKDNPTISTTHE